MTLKIDGYGIALKLYQNQKPGEIRSTGLKIGTLATQSP